MTTKTAPGNQMQNKQNKLALFQNVLLIAIADKYIDDLESDFLLTIGEQLELTEEDTRYIAENYATLSFIVPEDGLQKHMELQTLVMMVLQDGEVEEREYNLCLEYTHKIGFTKEILDNLIKILSKR